MNAGKRSKFDIYYELLVLICQEEDSIGKASPTRIARRANLPYYRFQKILACLIQANAVCRTDTGLLLTENGAKCLKQMHQTNLLLKRMRLIS